MNKSIIELLKKANEIISEYCNNLNKCTDDCKYKDICVQVEKMVKNHNRHWIL